MPSSCNLEQKGLKNKRCSHTETEKGIKETPDEEIILTKVKELT